MNVKLIFCQKIVTLKILVSNLFHMCKNSRVVVMSIDVPHTIDVIEYIIFQPSFVTIFQVIIYFITVLERWMRKIAEIIIYNISDLLLLFFPYISVFVRTPIFVIPFKTIWKWMSLTGILSGGVFQEVLMVVSAHSKRKHWSPIFKK